MAFIRRALPLPPVCPSELFTLALSGQPPDWAWRAPLPAPGPGPVEGSAWPRQLIGRWPLAGGRPASHTTASLARGPARFAQLLLNRGRPPPGGWQAWPGVALALPFFVGPGPRRWAATGSADRGARDPSWQGAGGWRVHRLLLAAGEQAGRPQLVLVVTSRLPSALLSSPKPQALAAIGSLFREEAALFARFAAVAEDMASPGLLRGARPAWRARGQWIPRASAGLPEGQPELRQSYIARIQAAQASMAAGRLHKIVLARFRCRRPAAGRQFAAHATFLALAARHRGAHVFLWRLARGAVFLGASPERLCHLHRGRVTTHAVAGTAAAGRDAERILSTAKHHHEHRLVVEAIERALSSCCRRVAVASAPRLRQAGDLVHLETPIEGQLRGPLGLLAVASTLHPTPALAGTPRRTALLALAADEPWRGLFGGCIGWQADSGGELAVAIRSAVVAPGGACLFAGAGIVAGSEAAAEWRETAAKMQAVEQALRSEPRN